MYSTCAYCKGAGYLYTRPSILAKYQIDVLSPNKIDKLSKYNEH